MQLGTFSEKHLETYLATPSPYSWSMCANTGIPLCWQRGDLSLIPASMKSQLYVQRLSKNFRCFNLPEFMLNAKASSKASQSTSYRSRRILEISNNTCSREGHFIPARNDQIHRRLEDSRPKKMAQTVINHREVFEIEIKGRNELVYDGI